MGSVVPACLETVLINFLVHIMLCFPVPASNTMRCFILRSAGLCGPQSVNSIRVFELWIWNIAILMLVPGMFLLWFFPLIIFFTEVF